MPLEKAPLASTVAAPQAELGVVTRRIELIDLRMLRGFCNLLVPVQPKLPPTVTQSINIVVRLGDEPNRSHTGVTVSFSIVGNYDNGAEGFALRRHSASCTPSIGSMNRPNRLWIWSGNPLA